MPASSRRSTVAALTAGAVVASLAAVTLPARAEHTPAPERVTVMGSLMSELGCVDGPDDGDSADWEPDCTLTDMQPAGDGAWELVAEVPAGSYEWKVRLDGSWDENYGVGGEANGPNARFALAESAELRFSYDHATHRIAVAPADLGGPVGEADEDLARDSLRKDLTEERFYFVMADRFANGDSGNDDAGLGDDRLVSGLDPTATGFFHGGDLRGLIDQLDYIEGLGTTALWLTPSFKNKPVQGAPGQESAGYHGYWITDFTQIDPHLGTNADMAELVDRAHARGIKVFFDIITNHTADVITYDRDEYVGGNLPYVSTEDEPYRDAAGNEFDDRDYADGDPAFPAVNLDSFPYRPIVPAAEDDVKVPAWLNDPRYYHNRGTSTFTGESNTYGDFPSGDFSSLDDLWTEHPDVVEGLTDVYQTWVREAGVDGFRIDTVKHVNTEFWQQFSPALTGYAAQLGNDDFFMFGEVFDANPEFVSQYTTEGKLQATVDFGFQGSATSFAKGKPTTGLRDFFASDDWYTDADSNAYSLPTFLGNHDMGRIGSFLREDFTSDDELLARDRLAHSLMYLTRGQPVVYYGDEQGFSAPKGVAGGPGDQRAREDMFASQVPLYNGYDLIGTDATTAEENYDPKHPLYRHIAALAELREAHPTLADGAQIHRYASSKAGVYAFSRIDPSEKREYVVAVNNSTSAASATLDTYAAGTKYKPLWPAGDRKVRSDAEGRITVTVPALSALVLRADSTVPADEAAPAPYVAKPTAGGTVGGRAEIAASVPGDDFAQVTIAWRPVGGDEWAVLGTDDNAPYRVYHDVRGLPKGTMVEYRVVAKDLDGDLGAAQTYALVGDPEKPGGGGGPVTQPTQVSFPGSYNSEVGCPGDWQPDCPAIDASLDAKDQVWKKTYEDAQAIPAGNYAYKAALEDSWDENYGDGAVRSGPDIPLTVPAGTSSVTMYYSRATNWVTDSLRTPHIFTAPGSFQSEIGCPGDWDPDCMQSWLQDPDGDNIWVYRSPGALPPGSYEWKVAQDESWAVNWGANGAQDGPNATFAIGEDQGVELTFDLTQSPPVLAATTFSAAPGGGGAPDLSTASAHWLTRSLVAWDLPSSRQGWTYRLYGAPEGGLEIDAEAITGGTSLPLTLVEGGLPADLAEQWPHLATYEALSLGDVDDDVVEELLSGQVAVAAFDGLGRLVAATGVQIPGVLDDVFAGAVDAELGVTWRRSSPTLSVWAPTAKDVDLLIARPGDEQEQRVRMVRDEDGVWSARGNPTWKGARYAYEVDVYVPSEEAVVTNVVTDPYSLALTTNSTRSVVVDLDDPALEPAGWDELVKPQLAQAEDSTIYELHVRDFSIGDATVPAAQRGTYLAFTDSDSDGMRHLQELADAGLNTVHLLPTFDIATIEEDRAAQATPDCDLKSFGPASLEQQECVEEVRAQDGFNWGYDPWHYTTPEGSYAVETDGAARTLEYRRMVAALNGAGLRVVQDVVYNHTTASGQDPKSVLDRVVPGYYQRLNGTGGVETSTCCANTAVEHAMMEKLMVDSVVTWATEYKVDGFRFDLMGHHPKSSMLEVREALDALTLAEDGVDGESIYLYGEGWNFGEVADDARFEQATQLNLYGTGIGSFTDRLRDAVRGGGPFDEDPGIQGFASGLFTDPNASTANGTTEAQRARLLHYMDQIKVGLAGNLRDYTFVDRTGATVAGSDVDYNGSPAGYAADPSETVTYVDAHDNETLFDALAMKLPQATAMDDRVRMNTIALSTTALSQGVSFWHAGADILRSKSLDRNSYDSGDWFNRVDWSYQDSTFGSGLPPQRDNASKRAFHEPLLADPDLKPGPAAIQAAHARALELLRIRFSSPLFRLGSADLIQQRVGFPTGGPDQAPGVLVMTLDDRSGTDLDPRWERVVVLWNATPDPQVVAVEGAGSLALHPVQAAGGDAVVKGTQVSAGSVEVPARSVAVLVQE